MTVRKSLQERIAEAYQAFLDECNSVALSDNDMQYSLASDIDDIKALFEEYVTLVKIEDQINKEAVAFWKNK